MRIWRMAVAATAMKCARSLKSRLWLPNSLMNASCTSAVVFNVSVLG
jgi:hypothetical protein